MSQTSSPTLTAEAFAAAVERVRASNMLGKGTQLQRLFEFLVTCQAEQRVPKEIEVAVGAFGRSADADTSQDATVRVTAHKLRKRLGEFYREDAADATACLTIPRGEYRLLLLAAQSAAVDVTTQPLPLLRRLLPATARERVAAMLIGALLLFCVALLANILQRPRVDRQVASVRDSGLWAPLLADDLPVQLVLGDYYIFGERDASGDIRRLVRDFNINSRRDLEQGFIADPARAGSYADLNLGYLPTSSAQALREVLPVVMASGKHVTLTLASELDPSTIKTTHIVYVGYLSALGMLQELVFAGSRYSFGGSYDELIDSVSGTAYVSEGGDPHAEGVRYSDYAYVASFTGPARNAHLIIAGTRDTGLMQAAEVVADSAQLEQLAARKLPWRTFEALYEVQGVNGINVESRLIDASAAVR